MDTSNEFMVVPEGELIKLPVAIPHLLSRDQALRLALWLAVLADPHGDEFNQALKVIREL